MKPITGFLIFLLVVNTFFVFKNYALGEVVLGMLSSFCCGALLTSLAYSLAFYLEKRKGN